MHQSPLKLVPRHWDRRLDLDEVDTQTERRALRAAPPKARKSSWRDEPPRGRSGRPSAR